jgi:hypothetical protein
MISYVHLQETENTPMTPDLSKTRETEQPVQEPAAEDDFFSDAPLVSCPLRKDGLGSDEICEACQ